MCGHVSLGESAFIGNDVRSATAIAKSAVVGLVLTHDRYEALCQHDPLLATQFLRRMNRLLALKLRKVSKDFADIKPDKKPEIQVVPAVKASDNTLTLSRPAVHCAVLPLMVEEA